MTYQIDEDAVQDITRREKHSRTHQMICHGPGLFVRLFISPLNLSWTSSSSSSLRYRPGHCVGHQFFSCPIVHTYTNAHQPKADRRMHRTYDTHRQDTQTQRHTERRNLSCFSRHECANTRTNTQPQKRAGPTHTPFLSLFQTNTQIIPQEAPTAQSHTDVQSSTHIST